MPPPFPDGTPDYLQNMPSGEDDKKFYKINQKKANVLRNGLAGMPSFEPAFIAGLADSSSPLTVRLHGKKLGTFGPSPDILFQKHNVQPHFFDAFIGMEQIKRVLLLDTKRLRLEPVTSFGQDTSIITPENVRAYYKKHCIEVFSESKGVRFYITDLHELTVELLGKAGCQGFATTRVFEELKLGISLGEVFKKCKVSDLGAINLFCKEYKKDVLPENAKDEEVLGLIYYPSSSSILAFIEALF